MRDTISSGIGSLLAVIASHSRRCITSRADALRFLSHPRSEGSGYRLWCRALYVKDAARGLVELAAASRDRIKTAIYLLSGPTPVPSAGELATRIRARVPGAQITFQPDATLQGLIDPLARPIADARTEWGWNPRYDLEMILDDFLQEVRLHPNRYEFPGAP